MYLNDWLSVDKSSGRGNTTITLTSDSYDGLEDRAESFKIKTQTKEIIINVSQLHIVPYIVLEKNEISCFYDGIGTEYIGVGSNVDWYIECASDWVNVWKTSSSTIGISVLENSGNERESDVYFKYGSNVYATLHITQGSYIKVLPKSENRIYYWGELPLTKKVKYGTNAMYITEGVLNNGVKYYEYDRPIIWLGESFAENVSGLKRISLPSSLIYLGYSALHYCDNLTEISFGGNEKVLGLYGVGINQKLKNFTFPESIVWMADCGIGGSGVINENMGAEEINIGPNIVRIGGGSFSGMGNTKRVNFWGMNPPQISISINGGYPFQNMGDCSFYAPIGSDYSEIEELCNIHINYELVAKEPTVYNTNICFDGNQTNLIKPRKTQSFLFYIEGEYRLVETESFINYGSDIEYKQLVYNGAVTNYGVLGYAANISSFTYEKDWTNTPYFYVSGANIEKVIFGRGTWSNTYISNVSEWIKNAPTMESEGKYVTKTNYLQNQTIVVDAEDIYGTRIVGIDGETNYMSINPDEVKYIRFRSNGNPY